MWLVFQSEWRVCYPHLKIGMEIFGSICIEFCDEIFILLSSFALEEKKMMKKSVVSERCRLA